MVDYKPRWFPKKIAHLTQTPNDFGTHDKILFTPAEDVKLRCFQCNTLLEGGILSTEGACTRCNRRFKKSEVRDMFVEAKQMQAVKDEFGRTGYTVERLAELYRLTGPGTIRPDGSVRPVGESARALTAFQLRQKSAAMRVVRAMRNSNISNILGSKPKV